MRYIRVRWNHAFPDEPVELFSEVDAEFWEIRKVEVFPDGRLAFASTTESVEPTGLGQVPLTSLDQIALDPQFSPELITKDEFESVWDQARRSTGVGSAW